MNETEEKILSCLQKHHDGIALQKLARYTGLSPVSLRRRLRRMEDELLVNKRYDENSGAILYLAEK